MFSFNVFRANSDIFSLLESDNQGIGPLALKKNQVKRTRDIELYEPLFIEISRRIAKARERSVSMTFLTAWLKKMYFF